MNCSPNQNTNLLLKSSETLRNHVNALRFQPPTDQVYNPLDYAWEPYADYLCKFGNQSKKVVFLGMNPGPWGMAQIGVPFGEITMIRDWLGISGCVGKPLVEHPKRPIEGFACERSEVSGRRLWGLFRDRFGQPELFFKDHFVLNYCPLVFMESTGRNRTPDKLNADERELLYAACDAHLQEVVQILSPDWLIGVGKFAASRAEVALEGFKININWILHPSPASPAANRDWAGLAERKLLDLGIWS